ncbi:hypothetical protein LINPERHAP1_LOCUS10030, partial [Linum perenne]
VSSAYIRRLYFINKSRVVSSEKKVSYLPSRWLGFLSWRPNVGLEFISWIPTHNI